MSERAMSLPRALAPVSTVENCEQLFRDALTHKTMLQYRPSGGTRKHGSVDSFSVSAVVQVLDQATPENKAKLIAKAEGHCGRLALFVWHILSKCKRTA